jgi:hypothetical protein
MTAMELEMIKPTETQLKARRNRSVAIALALVAFVVIVYVASIVRMGPAILDRAM